MTRLLIYILFVTVAAGCKKESVSGAGTITTEKRNAGSFTGVEIGGGTNAYIYKDSFSVEVKAYQNLLPFLETKVSNHLLFIAYPNNLIVQNDNSEAFIKLPFLNHLSMNGSGNITAYGGFTSTYFTASTAGSGNILLTSGAADTLNLKTEGSGNIKASSFSAKLADVVIRGSGNVHVRVSHHLQIKIYGSGNVYYEGNPAVIDSEITGSGQLIKTG